MLKVDVKCMCTIGEMHRHIAFNSETSVGFFYEVMLCSTRQYINGLNKPFDVLLLRR